MSYTYLCLIKKKTLIFSHTLTKMLKRFVLNVFNTAMLFSTLAKLKRVFNKPIRVLVCASARDSLLFLDELKKAAPVGFCTTSI